MALRVCQCVSWRKLDGVYKYSAGSLTVFVWDGVLQVLGQQQVCTVYSLPPALLES